MDDTIEYFEVLAEPKYERNRYLMIKCPKADCQWVGFTFAENRGKTRNCGRCGNKAFIPHKDREGDDGRGEGIQD